ncbi:MAG TPA: M3 family oligoendopeptidase [Gaiellaceae bacterium]|nr:M3 family oligoendopeptidase [Gaiellaceae bacterium]
MASTKTRAEDVRWDLSDICESADAARAGWDELVTRAADFASRYRGRVAELDAPEMRRLYDESDALEEELSRLTTYFRLRLALDTTDAEANDLATISRERVMQVQNDLVFLALEWIALVDDVAEKLLGSTELGPYAHKLRVARDEKPYVLSEPEEQAVNSRAPTISAWQALHDRHVATLEVPFDGGEGETPHTVSTLLSYLYRPERELRRDAHTALLEGLEPRTDVLGACYDALVGDRLGQDRLRGYQHPMQPTNMNNELDDETVDAMMAATEENYGIPRKWFTAKASALGIDDFQLYDQYAPIGQGRPIAWAEAVEIVDTSFGRFSPRIAEIFRSCLDAGHVDAGPRAGKPTGAFCTPVTKSVLPYILLNHTDQLRDVSTLAHEFGHAMQDVFTLERQTWLSSRQGIPLAEVPSTFAQSLSDDFLLETETDAHTRAALASARLEDAFAAIYRQTVLARFEQRAYAVRGEGKALTAERLDELWLEEQRRYYGDAVAVPDAYGVGWSYIPHFIHVRFYTYAYSFAALVALLLHRRYREDQDAFVPRYLEFLSLGGSASPAAQLEPFGLDLRSTDTWREAFAELDALRVEAEAQISAL